MQVVEAVVDIMPQVQEALVAAAREDLDPTAQKDNRVVLAPAAAAVELLQHHHQVLAHHLGNLLEGELAEVAPL